MEPAAPGTEEDVLLPSAFKKKENQQSRLLSLKAKLPNGVFGNVFEHSILNGSEHWYCNLCGCPIMGRIYHHETGKRHTANIQAAGGVQEPTEDASDADPEPPLNIAPGEPVPPGFEDNVEKVAQIQERLDSFNVDPLIGLEYLFELLEYDVEKEPAYLCCLCDKRGDPRTVISHLASYNHISQYLQRHFLKCYRALAPYMTKQYKRNWQVAMQKIAEAIETKFGRLKPHVVEKDVFERKRSAYQSMVVKGPHFNERVGVTFEELIVKDELTKVLEEDGAAIKQAEETVKRNYRKAGTEPSESVKRSPSPPVVAKPKKPKAAPAAAGEKRRSLSSVSSISSSDLSDFDPGQTEKTPKKNAAPKEEVKRDSNKDKPVIKKQRFSPVRESKRIPRFSPPPRNRSKERNDKRAVLPWQRSDYRSRDENPISARPKPKFDKQSEYTKLAAAIEKDMDRVLKQHEKHPEKHPQYNDEWKKFWNQRYKELQAEGKNPAGHDFKPEWIECWNKRLKELHANEVKVKKEALRKRLGIPDEPAPICFRITGTKRPRQRDENDSKLAPMASTPDQDPDVIVIDDKDAAEEKSSKRSRSPWEPETGRVSRRSRESRSRSRGRRSHSRGHRSHSRSNRSLSRGRRRSRSKDRLSRSKDHLSRNKDRKQTRSTSRGRNRNHRSRSRDREVEWPPRDQYREYPIEYETIYYRGEYPPEYIKPPRIMRDATRHPVTSPPLTMPVQPEPEPEPEDDGEINIVSVLRLLTALEEKLGSLGPKVIDLLSQALGMEKTEANSSESLLDNEINCVMFETVKEKLKGQLLAGLVNSAQEKAFKIAIKKIASLIYFAGERKKAKEREKPKVDPIQVAGVGKVDKGAIAKQIAAALIVQGKTDVTQAELEQLINAVVGMAEASKASNKPMTTASFLEQLTQSKAAPVENVEKTQKIALKSVLLSVAESSSTPSTNNMEGLSDSDLQTLLQNFKDLCTDEQHSLISYLKKLEAREPERVERLRKFVNLEASEVAAAEKDSDALFEKSDDEMNGKVSPFASRFAGTNPSIDDRARSKSELNNKSKVITKVTIDSDEEDYTFEDVFKAANKNIRDKEEKEEQERLANSADLDLSNAKSIIANLMGQFKSKSEVQPTPVAAPAFNPVAFTPNPVAPVVVPPPKPPSVPIPSNFPNTSFLNNISNINIQSLTNALNTAQAQQMKPIQPQIQPPISNPNTFSLEPRPQMNRGNPNLNSGSLQSYPQQNPSFQPRHLPGAQQQQLRDPNAHMEHTNSNFERPNLKFERPNPNFDRPNPNFERPNPNFERPNPNFERPNSNFERSDPNFERHNSNFERPDPNFERPNPNFERPNPNFERTNPNFDCPNSNFDRPNSNLDRPNPNFNRPNPNFDRPNPNFDRPNPNFDRPNPNYDRFNPNFEPRQKQIPPTFAGNNARPANFNRPQPDQLGRRSEYFEEYDDYDNTW